MMVSVLQINSQDRQVPQACEPLILGVMLKFVLIAVLSASFNTGWSHFIQEE